MGEGKVEIVDFQLDWIVFTRETVFTAKVSDDSVDILAESRAGVDLKDLLSFFFEFQ